MGRKGLLVAAAAVALLLSACNILAGPGSPFGCAMTDEDPCVIRSLDGNTTTQMDSLHEVVPPASDDAATLNISFVDPMMLGMEGGVIFLKAATLDGTLVLDRRVDPEDSQAMPPGDYTITAYYRACDGNCGILDPPADFCSVGASLAAGEVRMLEVSAERKRCTISG